MIAGGYRTSSGTGGGPGVHPLIAGVGSVGAKIPLRQRFAICGPSSAVDLSGGTNETHEKADMRPDLAVLPPRFTCAPRKRPHFSAFRREHSEKHRTYGTGPAYKSSAAGSSTRSTICSIGPSAAPSPRPPIRRGHRAAKSGIRTMSFAMAGRLARRRDTGLHAWRLAFNPLRSAASPICSARSPAMSHREIAQDLMAYPFFSPVQTHRVTPIDFAAGNVSIEVEAVPDHGMATIWDADILIWAASQIVEGARCGISNVPG